MVFVTNLLVQPSHAVVAISGFGAWANKVASSCRQAPDNALRPKPACSDRIFRGRTFGSAGASQKRECLIHPGIRWFGGDTGKSEDKVLLLIVCKKKSLVLDDGAASGESIVFVALWRGFRGVGRIADGIVPRAEEGSVIRKVFVAIVIVSGAVDFVGAGFG